MRLLLVEDDDLVADAVVRGLALAGYTVDHVARASLARTALHTEPFDLAILDIGLPDGDGLSLLQAVRSGGCATPVLMLTARFTLADKVRAFELGADDFLMKPFEQAELVARCRALMRRANQLPGTALHFGRLTADLSGHRLLLDDTEIELTRREWAVLEGLLHQAGRVVPKERLLLALAGWDQDLSANAVETHISRLRAKLADAVRIRAIRGLGYRLEEVSSAPSGVDDSRALP